MVGRRKAIPVLHSGQYVTRTGTPAKSSFTISCHIRIRIGYAFAIPLTSTATTGSWGERNLTSAGSKNFGWSIGGIPSGATPPEMISSGSTSGPSIGEGAAVAGWSASGESSLPAPQLRATIPIETRTATFLAAFRPGRDHRRPRRVEPWIATICPNLGRSRYRTKERRPIEVQIGDRDFRAPEVGNPELAAEATMDREALHQAMWRL